MAVPVAETEIQVKPPNPAETKKMHKDPGARISETRLGPLLQVGAGDLAPLEVPHLAAVAMEGAITL